MTPVQNLKPSLEKEADYRLTLFVAGNETNSRLAKVNLASLCDSRLPGRCEVEVVDVLEEFGRAVEESILVTPTLVVRHAGTSRTVIGNLSDREKLMTALGLEVSIL